MKKEVWEKNEGARLTDIEGVSIKGDNVATLSSKTGLDVNHFKNDLEVVRGFSTGLSAVFSEGRILGRYTEVMTDLNEVVTAANISIGSEFNEMRSEFGRVIEEVAAPLSAAVAEIGIANAKTVSLFANNLVTKEVFDSTQNLSAMCLTAIGDQQETFSTALAGARGALEIANIEKVTAPLQLVSEGCKRMMEVLPSVPVEELVLPSLESVRRVGKIDDDEISIHQRKLDSILETIDPALVESRRGCWECFREKKQDYIGQASSSMRRLVEQLLRLVAPDDEVIESDSLKDIKGVIGSNNRPTRKGRMLYALNFGTKKRNHLRRLVDSFIPMYDNVIAWDHVPVDTGKDQFVEGALIAIEGCLLSLLSEIE